MHNVDSMRECVKIVLAEADHIFYERKVQNCALTEPFKLDLYCALSWYVLYVLHVYELMCVCICLSVCPNYISVPNSCINSLKDAKLDTDLWGRNNLKSLLFQVTTTFLEVTQTHSRTHTHIHTMWTHTTKTHISTVTHKYTHTHINTHAHTHTRRARLLFQVKEGVSMGPLVVE